MKFLPLCLVAVATFSPLVTAVNIALNKAAFQSSEYTPVPGVAKNAVDGILETNYFKKRCTHTAIEDNPWWAVDLGQLTNVKDVTIYNRKDCCSNRLSNFDVMVTNNKPSTKNPPKPTDGLCAGQDGQAKDVATLTCKAGTVGRYVVIRLRGKNYLTLCEVQVNGAAVNIALNKAAFQSSEYTPVPGVAKNGVDGILETNYFKKRCTHTAIEANPWWAVDLGKFYDVTGLRIYNRKDCCSSRLSNFDIFVTNDKPSKANPPRATDRICAGQNGQAKDVADYACKANTAGRYVVIRLRGKNYLTLCEVQVFGNTVKLGNIALNKAAFQSSEYTPVPGVAKNGVDGILETNYFKKRCTHTSNDANSWWTVDFGATSDVVDVTLVNRKDCCSDRLKNFDIILSDKKPGKDGPPSAADGLCATQPNQSKDVQTYTCGKSSRGRYLSIRLKQKNYLTLCEVQVNGRIL